MAASCSYEADGIVNVLVILCKLFDIDINRRWDRDCAKTLQQAYTDATAVQCRQPWTRCEWIGHKKPSIQAWKIAFPSLLRTLTMFGNFQFGTRNRTMQFMKYTTRPWTPPSIMIIITQKIQATWTSRAQPLRISLSMGLKHRTLLETLCRRITMKVFILRGPLRWQRIQPTGLTRLRGLTRQCRHFRLPLPLQHRLAQHGHQ